MKTGHLLAEMEQILSGEFLMDRDIQFVASKFPEEEIWMQVCLAVMRE